MPAFTSQPKLRIRNGVSTTYAGVLVALVLLSSLATYLVVTSADTAQSQKDAQRSQALINVLESQNAALLHGQLPTGTGASNASLLGLNPVAIYQQASVSVVTVQGVQAVSGISTPVLGSGFVITFLSAYYVVTNFHVVQGVDQTTLTVTFSDGNAYPSKVVGTDPYSDLAVVSTSAPQSEYHPLKIGSSAKLVVGQPVVAIGNPFGLAGSETVGIVSQLGRTLSESLAGNFAIADVVQFSAPINPGNSGGPLLGTNGTVLGIATAVVAGSQGVGFAIPSDTIARELPSLVATGGYTMHPYLGIVGTDMDYQLAQLQGTNVTYGVLIQNLTQGGPADQAGLKGGTQSAEVQGTSYSIGGDIIIAINGTKIVNTDALSSYLVESGALPGQTIHVQIIRDGKIMTANVVLGTRPPPPSS